MSEESSEQQAKKEALGVVEVLEKGLVLLKKALAKAKEEMAAAGKKARDTEVAALAKAEEEALSAARDTWDAVETAKATVRRARAVKTEKANVRRAKAANVRRARAVKAEKVRMKEEANAVWAKALEALDKAKEDAWAEEEEKARQMELSEAGKWRLLHEQYREAFGEVYSEGTRVGAGCRDCVGKSVGRGCCEGGEEGEGEGVGGGCCGGMGSDGCAGGCC